MYSKMYSKIDWSKKQDKDLTLETWKWRPPIIRVVLTPWMIWSANQRLNIPISTLWSHVQITPLLYHQSNPLVWPMVISSQSHVSTVSWVLSDINAPILQYLALIVVPWCIQWCLHLAYFQCLLLYRNVLITGNAYFKSCGPKSTICCGAPICWC